MPDVFTKAKRSAVMARIRSRGNRDTELALAGLLRAHKIIGWRRHRLVRVAVEGRWLRVEGRKTQGRGGNIQHSTSNIQHPTNSARGEPPKVVRRVREALKSTGG